jgi:hypothetical protein
MKPRIYIGIHDATRVIFRSEQEPTQATHGNLYAAVIGPFKTLRGARFMRAHGRNNPHAQTVADAERLAKIYA